MLVLACSSLPLAALSTSLESGDADSACTTHGTCDVSLDETSAMQIRKGTSGVGRNSEQNPFCPVPVKFFAVDKVNEEIPLPPSTYPEALQGLLWMDQSGAYGFSDMWPISPDAVVSFADPITPWAPKEKTISIAPWGKTWTWFNTAKGYVTWGLAKFVSYVYTFEFNSDLTHAQIFIEADLSLLGKFRLPASLFNATMQRQTPPQGACPPLPEATKEQKSKCATWRRETTYMPGWPIIGWRTYTYYIYTIADNKGKKLQPYFDAYAEFASLPENNQADPDEAKQWLGVDLKKAGGVKPGQSFVGTQSRTIPGVNPCNPDSPCQNLFSSPTAAVGCLSAAVGTLVR